MARIGDAGEGLGEESRSAVGRGGQYERERAIPGEDGGGAHQCRDVAKSLAAAAAREHCYQRTIQRQVVFPEKLLARQGRAAAVGQRMPDIGDGNAVIAEKCLFERKDTEQPVDDAAHGFDAAFAPGPDLRGDQPDHRDAEPFEFPGGAEMEIRGIRENRHSGFSLGRGMDQLPEAPPDAGQMRNHFDDPDDGQVLGPHDGFDAGFAKVGSGATEKCGVGPAAAEFGDELGGIVIARSFSGGDQMDRGGWDKFQNSGVGQGRGRAGSFLPKIIGMEARGSDLPEWRFDDPGCYYSR